MSIGNPRTITIVLSDGDPDGIRTAEIGISATKVVAFRRSQLKNVCEKSPLWMEKPGVYLLYGQDPKTEADVVYIGESEDVASRLKNHNSNKKELNDYWTDTVVMLAKGDELNKSHVRYVEAKLIAAANHNVVWKQANKQLVNGKPPKAATIPEADTIKMEQFIEEAQILVRALGCDVFKATSGNLIKEPSVPAPSETLDSPEFQFSGSGFNAIAIVSGTSGEWIVKASSHARAIETKALPNGVKKLRESLKSAGILVESGDALEFKQDCSFKSPSTAANVVAGTPTNGRLAWKLASEVSYADWESTPTAIDPSEFKLG